MFSTNITKLNKIHKIITFFWRFHRHDVSARALRRRGEMRGLRPRENAACERQGRPPRAGSCTACGPGIRCRLRAAETTCRHGRGAYPAGSFFRHGAKETKAPPLRGALVKLGGETPNLYTNRYPEQNQSSLLPIIVITRFPARLPCLADVCVP